MAPSKRKISKAKKEIAYEIHRPARRIYNRRHVSIRGFRDLFQADLIDMINYKEFNRSHSYILLVIDCFSKYVFARPMKKKEALDTTEAMRSILESKEKTFLKPPKFLHVDRGKEFHNKMFKKMLAEFGITMYSTGSNVKASIAERAIRTVKTHMFREFSAQGSYNWIDILSDLITLYNNTVHRTIKMAPEKVRQTDESRLQALHKANHVSKLRGKVKFEVGDYVRISKYKKVFDKGYLPNWSTEIFKVIEVRNTTPVTYILEDEKGQPLFGGFYNEELSSTIHPKDFLVEKVLKKEGKKHFVKWLGFPDSENAWIKISDYV